MTKIVPILIEILLDVLEGLTYQIGGNLQVTLHWRYMLHVSPLHQTCLTQVRKKSDRSMPEQSVQNETRAGCYFHTEADEQFLFANAKG